jgi:hypothetical protein
MKPPLILIRIGPKSIPIDPNLSVTRCGLHAGPMGGAKIHISARHPEFLPYNETVLLFINEQQDRSFKFSSGLLRRQTGLEPALFLQLY